VDGLWATKSEDVIVVLIGRAISFQEFQPMWSWSTNVIHGQTHRQTTCNRERSIRGNLQWHVFRFSSVYLYRYTRNGECGKRTV